MIKQLPFRPVAGDMEATGKLLSRTMRQSGTTLTMRCTAMVTCLLLNAPVVHAEVFTPPAMEGFTLHSERDADGDGDGVNETHIMQYMNPHGDSLFSMTTKGRTWAWSLDARESDSGSSNYVIRDSDCDGTFDEVYGLDEEFHVPDCVE